MADARGFSEKSRFFVHNDGPLASLSNYETEQSDNANVEECVTPTASLFHKHVPGYRRRSLHLAAADKNLLEAGG